ncbi:histidine triad nucleotide-binding protein 3-like isoform X2 [Chrysoperla carnea]|uniref:histidine triad nucleotide-binding protein 3-like isoform X2 n=1 Tax=Chrysoperla carnea TaxID=189513 RepID=UPI001D067D2A|nr:histidine triad nucleotide-binding protein 3-like isoform X2 [Chrysoperla carnea]
MRIQTVNFVHNQILKKMCDRAKCIFCRICDNLENNEIVYSDEKVIAFHDIKPVAKTHLLIVPRVHIKNAKTLASTDKELVEHLVDVGKQLLNNSENGKLDDSLIGFHWPPLTSINHLHLHVISPASEMNLLHWLQFKPNSYWFVSPDYVLSRL